MKKQRNVYRDKYRTSSLRLKNWDYRNAGKYFITICTKNRALSFGSIVEGKMELNDLGRFAYDYLNNLNLHNEYVKMIIHVIMPNHLHAILQLKGIPEQKQTATFGPLQSGSLSSFLNQYKGKITKYATKNQFLWEGWQDSFYDHIIRNDQDYENIYNYIRNNPSQWENDRFYR
jgi:putative transposase